jgi:serine/threonine protein kinase
MSKQSNHSHQNNNHSGSHGHHKVANNSNEIEIETKYKFGRTLGHGMQPLVLVFVSYRLGILILLFTGTFATVRLATRLADGADFAVKIVKRSSLSREDENALKMEIQILQSTSHHHIISIKEVTIVLLS